MIPLAAAGALMAAASRPAEEPAADRAEVDRYIERLAATVPPPPAARLSKVPAAEDKDDELSKTAARADRAEPVVGAVLDMAR